MTDDDIVTVIQANKFSSDPLAIYRAIIAARDEELRKQEPVAWMIECSNAFVGWWNDTTKLDCRYFDADPNKGRRFNTKEEAEELIQSKGNSCMKATGHLWVNEGTLKDGMKLSAAPIPPAGHYKDALIEDLDNRVEPTPSQQARPLDEWDEWNGNVLWWKFPIDEPPYVGTPLDTDWPKYHTHWTPLGVPDMPLPARPDEVTKNDRNKDGAIEFIDAVVLNKPIWPNPWGQDVAFVAFVIHSDRQRIAELEAENAQARKTAEYWKAEHLAGNARIAELEAELTEWEKLKDPINLHVNLLRGVPCRLDRMQHLLHLAGATDYDYLKAANAKMKACLEAITEHHWERGKWFGGSEYHTERRDFAREAMK